jgi:hypothetical protein
MMADGITTGLDPSQSTLSPNFSQYVYNMLGKAEGLANLPYQEYTGQRFAGPSALQEQAFKGIGSLGTPGQFGTATQFATQAGQTAGQINYAPAGITTGLGPVGTVQSYMNPYMSAVTDIQAREARRQADIARTAEQARLAQAGAYGGSRQAIMEAERQRNLGQQIGDITEKGLQSAFDRATQQRLQEAGLGLEAQRASEQSRQFGAGLGIQGLGQQLQAASTLGSLGTQEFGTGLRGLETQLSAGETQRKLVQEPLDFGYQQFQESMKYPYQQSTFLQSMLQGLPLTARPYESGASGMTSALQGGLSTLALLKALGIGS